MGRALQAERGRALLLLRRARRLELEDDPVRHLFPVVSRGLYVLPGETDLERRPLLRIQVRRLQRKRRRDDSEAADELVRSAPPHYL